MKCKNIVLYTLYVPIASYFGWYKTRVIVLSLHM